MFSGIRSKLTIAFNPEQPASPGIHDGYVTLRPTNDRAISSHKVAFDIQGDLDELSEEERLLLPVDIKTAIETTLVENQWDFKVDKVEYNQHLMA